jgi:hypothetical protein
VPPRMLRLGLHGTRHIRTGLRNLVYLTIAAMANVPADRPLVDLRLRSEDELLLLGRDPPFSMLFERSVCTQ